MEDDKIL